MKTSPKHFGLAVVP